MESMLNIYDNVRKNNIIDDNEFLRKMMNIYKGTNRPLIISSGKKHRNSDFYDELVKSENDVLDSTLLDENENIKFYIDMTNIWIDNILKLTSSDLKKMTKDYQALYISVINVVKKYGKVHSIEEVYNLYDAICKSIKDGLFLVNDYKLFWVYFQGVFGFCEHACSFNHIRSGFLSARREKDVDDVEYRLYINCARKDIIKIVRSYIKHCNRQHIPFYFKYSESVSRKDKIVVFCSKKHIKNNVEILKNIAKEYPDVVYNCGPMLDLVGNVDGWIGIASEPSHSLNCKHSFNTLRAEILEDAAENVVLKYIFENINKKVVIDGREQSFNEIILDHAMKIVIDNIKEMSKFTKKDYSSLLNDQRYINYLKSQLLSKTETGKNNIMNGFNRLAEVALSKNKPLGIDGKHIFEFDLLNGHKMEFTIRTMDKLLKSMVDVMINTPSFDYLSKYREEIKKLCPSHMVDSSCFAFNTTTKKDFESIDLIEKKKEMNLQKLEFIRGVYYNLPIKAQNRRVLINGNISIPLLQYFEEFLVKYLDDNFNYVKDSSGTILLVDKIMEILENSIPSTDNNASEIKRAKIISRSNI